MEIAKVRFRQQPLQPISYNQKCSAALMPYSKPLTQDSFTRSKTVLHKPVPVSFSGRFSYSDLLIRYMKNMAYKNSIRGSKRPYIQLDNELEKFTKEIKIPVTGREEINALDINPKNSRQYVIFLHGFSHNITSNQPLYKALAQTDYGVLAIDYRGYGKNKPSKHINENDIVQDVEAAYRYLLNSKGAHTVGLIGHSFGGYVAARVSSIQNFAFQILVSPLTSLEFWLKNVIKHPKKYKKEMRMIKYIPSFGEQYSKIFNIKKYLSENYTATYIVQGKNDRYIRTSKVTELTKSIPNLRTYRVIPKGGHRMDDKKICEITDIVSNL